MKIIIEIIYFQEKCWSSTLVYTKNTCRRALNFNKLNTSQLSYHYDTLGSSPTFFFFQFCGLFTFLKFSSCLPLLFFSFFFRILAPVGELTSLLVGSEERFTTTRKSPNQTSVDPFFRLSVSRFPFFFMFSLPCFVFFSFSFFFRFLLFFIRSNITHHSEKTQHSATAPHTQTHAHNDTIMNWEACVGFSHSMRWRRQSWARAGYL